VVSGALAAEQHTFYEDPGISITGTMRAILSGGEAGGGSTITQQMARNYYGGLGTEQTITRKVREIFIALKLGQDLSHDEILTQYLNTIYFGRGASGVEAAAQAYFGKSVSELDDAEGAFIGMIIQQPSAFANPEPGGPHDRVMRGDRWEYMKVQLAELHEVNPDYGLPEDEAQALEFPEPIAYDENEGADPQVGYIYNAMIDELDRRYEGVDGTAIATGGYTIETSLDETLMDKATEAFEVLPPGAEDTMFGLTAVDPATGEIKAFNGGPNAAEVANNSLTHQTQAGSSYKPYVLATALEQGIGLRSMFDGDSPREFPGLASEVINAGGASFGDVNLIDATADSINTPFVDLAIRVGESNVDNMAVEMGVNPARLETSTQGPLIALGTHQVNALDQASAYATFASGGTHYPAHMITEVRNSEGEVVEPIDQEEIESGTPVLEPGVAADATYAMRQVVEVGGGTNAQLSDGRQVAGKTGTSSDAVSAWFVGYTPQLSVSVGLSRHGGGPLEFEGVSNAEVFGGGTSALVWKDFMETAMEGVPEENFPEPQWVGTEQSFLPTPEPSDEPTEETSDEPSDEPSESPTDECPPGGDPENPECPQVSDEPTDECEPWDLACQGEGDDDTGSPPPDDDEPCWGLGCEDETPPGQQGRPDASQRTVLGRDDE
jgi:membrane peptidoglycan carboxypeptidase